MKEKLKSILPQTIYDQLDGVINNYKIDTPLRLAHFLSQCAHESAEFRVFTENLNYSAEGLLKIFRSDFDTNRDRVLSETERKVAQMLARKPEQIANFVYANQNGNGDVNSGDGWKYRGRGCMMLTGKANYASFNKDVPDDIISNPELVSSKYNLLSAAWFWNKNNLNKKADYGSNLDAITMVTKVINGGTIGLGDRVKKFEYYYKILTK